MGDSHILRPISRAGLLLSVKLAILVVVFLILFRHTFVTLAERFSARDSYYSHGFIIPFIVLYLIWNKRAKLRRIEWKPSVWGLAVVFAGCLLHIVSTFLKINFTSYLAIPIVIAGIVYALGGMPLLYEMLFPIAFLIFMLPLPKVFIIGITFKLKLMVAKVSTYLANLIGIAAEEAGSTIYYPGGYLIVGDPCSGLRSLISFLALGALLTQFMNAARWKKIVLFFCSIPIALVSNVVRIFFLIIVSYVYGEKVALGPLHEASGMVVFILGFVLLVFVARWLKAPLSTRPSAVAPVTQLKVGRYASGSGNFNFVGVTAVMIVFLLLEGWIMRTGSGMASRDRLKNFPLKVGEWKGEDIPQEESVYRILGTKDVLIRRYDDGKGEPVVLAIVYSARNRDSFHPPEYCYLGGGLQLLEKQRDTIKIGAGARLVVNKLVMGLSDKQGQMVAWYWYAAGRRFFASYYKQQLILLKDIFTGKSREGALIRVSVERYNEEASARAKKFIRDVLPEIYRIF